MVDGLDGTGRERCLGSQSLEKLACRHDGMSGGSGRNGKCISVSGCGRRDGVLLDGGGLGGRVSDDGRERLKVIVVQGRLRVLVLVVVYWSRLC